MPHAYTEDQLVEQPAIGLFAEPGCSLLPRQVALDVARWNHQTGGAVPTA